MCVALLLVLGVLVMVDLIPRMIIIASEARETSYWESWEEAYIDKQSGDHMSARTDDCACKWHFQKGLSRQPISCLQLLRLGRLSWGFCIVRWIGDVDTREGKHDRQALAHCGVGAQEPEELPAY